MKNTSKNLNESQLRAVEHGETPLLVVAGAGTGKTTMLAHRVASLVARGAAPERILLLTFTRRAALELVERAKKLLETTSPQAGTLSSIWGGTFHAVGMRLLRIYGKNVGLPPHFSIVDRADQEDLMNLVRSELNFPVDKKRFPKKGTCVSIYSRCINSQKKLYEILDRFYPKQLEFHDELAQLFDAYTDRKLRDATLDYDDLLLYWAALMRHPEIGERIRQRFDWILVDEYQDTNLIQAEIVHGLTPDGKGLTVVGDDAQSIFSFRAATVRNILDIPQIFPNTTILSLEKNYRSSQSILEATNRVVEQLRERYRKELFSTRNEGVLPMFVRCEDEDAQSQFVVEQILQHHEEGIPFREQAVLYRSSHHSLRLETELTRRRIPYIKYGGLKFTEAAHVKDLLAFLRIVENPHDFPAGIRLLTLLPGLGPKKANTLMENLRDAEGNFNVWSSWTPPRATQTVWFPFVDLLKRLAPDTVPLQEQLYESLQFYKPLLIEKYPNDSDSRYNDLEQLVDVAKRFRSRQEMLSDFVLDPPQSSEAFASVPDRDDDYLILSTIHSAKGLEWTSVFIIHASDGNIPSDMATGRPDEIDEELRLFYVAMTRAKDYLYVTCPMRYFHLGPSWNNNYSRVIPTRFLPPRILKTAFDEEYVANETLRESNGEAENILKQEGLTLDTWIKKQTEDLW
ncbi:MAG: ATP-dependent helicase [Planctomycetia bacterium]|nr:ATP-dependent helicase [Planctomycetia bacterium]